MKIFGLACLPPARSAAAPGRGHAWATRRFKDWLIGHARQLLTAIALLVGGYMVLSGTLRLLG